MKNKSYWFITVFEKIPNKNNLFDLGASRCWGFYTDYNKALETLHNNITDLYENFYNYAVLEEYYEGILSTSGKRQFFIFNRNKNGYIEIDEPKCFSVWSGFAIG